MVRNYSQGLIYAIRSYLTSKIYIGSTTQELSKRMTHHRWNFKYWQTNGDKYLTSFEIIKYGDAYIELLEMCPCVNRMELERREGELIRENDCVNKNIAGRTIEEYRQDNAESIKQYRLDHQTESKQYFKEYRQDNAESIKQYRLDHQTESKRYFKEYRKENIESIKQYRLDHQTEIKQYRQDNKQAISFKRSQRIACSYCDNTFARGDKNEHLRTRKHQSNYKQAFLDCFGEEFTDPIPLDDY
jgi:hypothetical protein